MFKVNNVLCCQHFKSPSLRFTRNVSNGPRQHSKLYKQGEALKSKNRDMIRNESLSRQHPSTQEFTKFDFTTLEAQMASLKTKGFMRFYKSYSPPDDLQHIFTKTCSSVLGKDINMNDLQNINLDSAEIKFKVLNALSLEFDHNVHNSRLRDMCNLQDVFQFYSTPIDMKTPYDRLHEASETGQLPPNLQIQKDAVRFTGKGEHPMDQVTAYPRSSTIVTGLYARDKYKGLQADLDAHSENDYE